MDYSKFYILGCTIPIVIVLLFTRLFIESGYIPREKLRAFVIWLVINLKLKGFIMVSFLTGLILGILLIQVWYGRYTYERWSNNNLIRISKFSGDACRLTAYGWTALEPKKETHTSILLAP